MEKFINTLKLSDSKGLEVGMNASGVDAAQDYAKMQLTLGGGNYSSAIIFSQWKSNSENFFRQAVDPIVYNNNL